MSSYGNNTLLKQEIENCTNLPVLPPGISHLLKALNNNDIHYIQLAEELENFPSIAVKIVAIANSAWALPESPITNLHDACTRIGLNIVRSVSIALSISQVFDPTRCSAFSSKTFWVSALLNAESACICAKDNPNIDPATARFAGLLHNIGLLWLANKKPEETKTAILETMTKSDYSLSESLKDKLDMDYHNVGEQLALSMELPEIIVQAVASKDIYNGAKVNPLVFNQHYAKQLTSAVLQQKNADNSTNEFKDDPHFLELAEKLPRIQSMAQSIFLN